MCMSKVSGEIKDMVPFHSYLFQTYYRMAHSIEIFPVTFSKYRRINKISDRLFESIAKLIDQKRISFEVGYRISGWEESDIQLF